MTFLNSLFGKKKRVTKSKTTTTTTKAVRPRPDALLRKQAKKYKVKISSKNRGYRKISVIKKEIKQKRKVALAKKATATKKPAKKATKTKKTVKKATKTTKRKVRR